LASIAIIPRPFLLFFTRVNEFSGGAQYQSTAVSDGGTGSPVHVLFLSPNPPRRNKDEKNQTTEFLMYEKRLDL